jgi:hypothetical protein
MQLLPPPKNPARHFCIAVQVAPAQVHFPAAQPSPSVPVHAAPHMPQLAVSLVVSAHLLAQHTWGAVHFVPQAPQLLLSATVLMHAPLHATSPMFGHVQVPFLQVAPMGQTVPHIPQFIVSLLVSTHTSPQT